MAIYNMELPIITIDLFMPEKTKLATIIKNELSTDFENVTVEWVKCPNLIRKPFRFSAPGLCGDTAILDIGGVSNLFPFPKRRKIFYFKKILDKLNRTQSRNFIIGGGLCTSVFDQSHLAELITDVTFWPGIEQETRIRNRSLYAFQKVKEKELQKKVILKSINEEDPKCVLYGNFFVSKGQREEVLKVRAKNRIGREFIDALQHAISRFPHKTQSQLIGLGGAFMVKNGLVVHHVIQNDWVDLGIMNKEDMHQCVQYKAVSTPVMAFATFVSADRYNHNPGLKEIFLTRSRAYSYSMNICGGGQYLKTIPQNDTKALEYVGYFSVARKLYRVDPAPMFYEMPDLCYLSNY